MEEKNTPIEDHIDSNYGAIFNAASDAIFINDIETGRVIDANVKACEMFCYPKDEIVGLSVADLSLGEEPYTAEEVTSLMKKAANGEPQMFEWLAKDKAGRGFWIEVNLKRAVIAGKYMLTSIVRDITERKKTEERFTKINEVFLSFGADSMQNINNLTSLCGELMEADCALYNKLEGGMLTSCGRWNVPEGFKPVDNPEGHVCYDVIKKEENGVMVVQNLQDTDYAKTDRNVLLYNLKTYIGCPVKFGGERVGSLCVVYQYDFSPTEEDTKIMSIIASAIGVEEERKSAENVLLKRDYQLEILSRTTQHINAILEIPIIIRTLVAAAMELVGAQGGLGGVLKDGKLCFTEYNRDGKVEPIDYIFNGNHGVFACLTKTLKPYISNDAGNDPQIIPEKKKAFGLYNLVSVPILNGTGEIIGCFEIHNKKDRELFDTQDVFMLQGLAASAAIALENAKMLIERKNQAEVLRQEKEMMQKYLDIAGILIVIIDRDQKVSLINKKGCEILGYSQEEIVGKNWFDNFIPEGIREQVKLAYYKIIEGDIKPVEYFENPVIAKSGEERIIAWHNAVLKDENGRITSALSSGNDITEDRRAEKEKERLHKEIINVNKRLKQLALRDFETGLYNHHYLAEVIESEFYRARRYGHPLSVIMLDIDYFKSINDVYGNDFGDLVLKQFAAHLKRMVRRYDIPVRYGGEEFVVISPGVDKQKVLMMAQRLLDAINLYSFGNKKSEVKLKVSIAVVSYPDGNIMRGMDLMNQAIKILDKVKASGGNKVYSPFDVAKGRAAELVEMVEPNDVRFLKEKIEKLTSRSKQSLMESIFAFAKTIELKDHYTGEHVENTVHYSMEIARALNLAPEELENIRQASVLHDLGKIGISDKILLKKSKLTKKEFETIKKHPQIAADIIRPIHFMHDIIPLILYHHERWDGKGYPAGLKGEEIPIGARIIAVADVYQALTSTRPYRKAFSKREAIDIVKNGSGTQFDARIVAVFMKILKKEKR